jgi:hypothetical protein
MWLPILNSDTIEGAMSLTKVRKSSLDCSSTFWAKNPLRLIKESRAVSFNDSFGGSENQLRFLLKYLSNEDLKDINLILNNANHDLIVVGKFPRPLPISLNTDTTYIINFDTN